MKKKVFVVGTGIGYADWIEPKELVNDISQADVVLFTGGEDINPKLYGQEAIDGVYFNDARDRREIEAFNQVRKDQLCVGICRGLQLFNVLHGGILVQDVSNHILGWGSVGYTHEIHNRLFQYEITSLHHQMVYPFNLNPEHYKIIYWTSPRSDHYSGFDINVQAFQSKGEPEVVLYTNPEKPVCLGIQGHPEMMPDDSPVNKMLNELVNDCLDGIKSNRS